MFPIFRCLAPYEESALTSSLSNEAVQGQCNVGSLRIPGILRLLCFLTPDRLLFRQRAVRGRRGWGRRDRRAPGRRAHAHERPEEGGRTRVPVHSHKGNYAIALALFALVLVHERSPACSHVLKENLLLPNKGFRV